MFLFNRKYIQAAFIFGHIPFTGITPYLTKYNFLHFYELKITATIRRN